MKAGTELHEHDWNGSGRVTVRFQRGLPVGTAMAGTDGRLQIDKVPEEAWCSPERSVRRRLARTSVRIRVAYASEGRSPIWFELPVIIHRPMPADGLIRSASITREKIGLTWRYRLSLTIASPPSPPPVAQKRPSIALDLGWRLVPDGLRVAAWVDTEGGPRVHHYSSFRSRGVSKMRRSLGRMEPSIHRRPPRNFGVVAVS